MIGRWLSAYRYELNIVGGVIVVLFGLFMTGLLKIGWLQREFRFYGNLPGGRTVAANLLGLEFAFGWTPCIGPVLGAILTLSATSGLMSDGTVLLTIYSLGLGVPFFVAALFTDRFLHHALHILSAMGACAHHSRCAPDAHGPRDDYGIFE